MDDYNKQCSRCQEIKGRSEFSKDKRAKDGLTSACLECYRLANKKTGNKYATSWAPRSPLIGCRCQYRSLIVVCQVLIYKLGNLSPARRGQGGNDILNSVHGFVLPINNIIL